MSKLKILNSTTIKIIACILMFADHIHETFYHVGAPLWLTYLGRPVFIMFLFATSEGWSYTHSKREYLERLAMASVVTSVLFLMLSKILPNENIVLMNNAIATFFIAAVWMYALDKFKEKKIWSGIGWLLLPFILTLPILISASSATGDVTPAWAMPLLTVSLVIPSLMSAEGGIAMVVIGVLLYALRKWRWAQVALIVLVSIGEFFIDKSQAFMIFAIIPMLMYNGEKGKGLKNFFYIFYPAHIAILYVISTLVFGGVAK